MKLPNLLISGAKQDLTVYVRLAAKAAGFVVLSEYETQGALEAAKDPDTLLLWVTPQPDIPQVGSALNRMERPRADCNPFNLHANAVLYCTDNLGELPLQINRFLGEIRSGAIAPTLIGQAWRGFIIPSQPKVQLVGTFEYESVSA